MINTVISLPLHQDEWSIAGERQWRYTFLNQEVGNIQEHRIPGLKTYFTVNGSWKTLHDSFSGAQKEMRSMISLEFVKP